MNEDFARPAWADHHARLAADLSRGLARLARLFRRPTTPRSLSDVDAQLLDKAPHDQAGAVTDVDGGAPEPTGGRAA